MHPLQKLFDSQILDDDTKEVIKEAFDNAVEAKSEELKESAGSDELTKETLDMISEGVANELESIKDEIQYARTLDVEYAEKFETFKEQYAEEQEARNKEEIAALVKEEFSELREDIEQAKKNEFGRKIFEDYQEYFSNSFGQEDSVDLKAKLDEANAELYEHKRQAKINELLEGVEGRTRNIAMNILEGTRLENMDSRFETVKGLLLSEDTGTGKEDGKPLNEGKEDGKDDDDSTLVIESEDVDKGKQGRGNGFIQRSLKFKAR